MRFGLTVVVLAALVLPVASAQTEEANGYATEGLAAANSAAIYAMDQANYVAFWAIDGLSPQPSEETPPEPEEAAAEHEAPRAGHSHPEHEEEAAPAEEPAPREEDGLLQRASRLVPIPVALPGPAPRIDLDAIDRIIAETAPTPAPSARSAEAPLAPASISQGPIGAAAEAAPEVSAAALVVAAAANTGAPLAAALWERFRRLGWLALLYTRIAKERLLDHGSRERLLDAIRARPGLAVADLSETSDIPRNTVTYHLRVLEREGLVSSTRNGRNRLFFSPGSLPQRANADAIATLRHETTLAVAKAVGANPGVDQKAICTALGLSPSLAHWHADRLVATGLVDKKRDGRSVRYYPGAAFEIVSARSA